MFSRQCTSKRNRMALPWVFSSFYALRESWGAVSHTYDFPLGLEVTCASKERLWLQDRTVHVILAVIYSILYYFRWAYLNVSLQRTCKERLSLTITRVILSQSYIMEL